MPLYRSARAGQWRSSGAHRRGRSGATLGAPAGVLPISRLARMAWRTCQRGPPPHEMTALVRPEFWVAGARGCGVAGAPGPQSIDASGKAVHTSAATADSLALALHGKPQPPRVAPAPVAAAVIRCQAMPGGYEEI